MSYKIFALLNAFIAVCAAKVPVTIYYESLCPDSAKFITEQVYPSIKNGELREVLELQFVPFGKSQFSTQGAEVEFNCHHGPNECYGNKVHACAIEHIQANSYQTENTRESLILDFINCMMKAGKNFPDNVYPGQRCAMESQISSWENIKQCANSTEGSVLLKKQGEITNKFQNPLASVPTVVFNQQFDDKINKRSMDNFVGSVCQFLSQPQPKICAGHNAAGTNSVSSVFTTMLGGFLIYAVSRLL